MFSNFFIELGRQTCILHFFMLNINKYFKNYERQKKSRTRQPRILPKVNEV